MRTFAVTHLKGGVGKTTTTLALAGLLHERGFRVLLVDFDPQASLTTVFGLRPEQIGRGSHTLFLGNAEALAIRSVRDGLDLLPSSPALARVERLAERPEGLGRILQRALTSVAASYHIAFIDCPPALGVLQINALAAAERLVVPVQCEHLAIEGLRRLDNTLAMMARSRGGRLPDRFIVPTMVDFRTRAAHIALDTLRTHWAAELSPHHIPEDNALREAVRLGKLPHEHAPRSRGVTAYRNLLVALLAPRARDEALGAEARAVDVPRVANDAR